MQHLTRNSILAIMLFVGGIAFSQDTLDLDAISVSGGRLGLKKIGLYDGEYKEEYNIRGFTQVAVFDGNLSDFWTSEGARCISGKLDGNDEESYLKLKWNKDQGGCDWVGMGFGWDGWSGKDISYVVDTLALEFEVRSTGEDFTNIPWAFCMEDYSGGQAWIGYNKAYLKAEAITKEWSVVQIPLSAFPFEQYEVDASNIKQLLIQVFAEGEIEVKSIELVPFSGKMREEVVAKSSVIKVDGNLDEWDHEITELNDGTSFAVSYSEEYLNFALTVSDNTPRQNSQTEGMLWNGDAVEITFSTNPAADPKRSFLLLSDQHIGINCGDKPYVWNWKTNEVIKDASIAFEQFEDGYTLEVSIPVSLFRNFTPSDGMNLGMEIAIDKGTLNGRNSQVRWNSKTQEGFNQSPQLWGSLILD